MRMRKKKNRDLRMKNCSNYLIDDFSKYYTDLKGVFSDNKPLHLELGCGKGGFISKLAKVNPDINYIAFEKNQDVLVLAMEKAKNDNLSNIKFYSGDLAILSEIKSKSKCDRIYINFCDPWQKRRYAKRRLTHTNFLNIYKNIIKENGEIFFKTDNKDLFEFSLNSFSDFGLRLKNITLDLHKSDYSDNIMTEYEKLFSEKGNPIYRCEALFL